MTYVPTWPADHAHAAAAKFRQQFGGLKDLIDAVPAGPPGADGADGADGAVGPQGPAGGMVFPVIQNAIFDAPLYVGSQELKFDTTRDIGGSSESLAGISAIDLGSGPLLQIRCRGNGADKSIVRLDPTGIQDGAGSPTVQDGDLLRYDAASQTWEPVRRVGLAFADLTALGLTVSDPPTQAELQAVADRQDEILSRLQAL